MVLKLSLVPSEIAKTHERRSQLDAQLNENNLVKSVSTFYFIDFFLQRNADWTGMNVLTDDHIQLLREAERIHFECITELINWQSRVLIFLLAAFLWPNYGSYLCWYCLSQNYEWQPKHRHDQINWFGHFVSIYRHHRFVGIAWLISLSIIFLLENIEL